jgi:uncharacterized membrane protein YidH (DUF202 family)
VTAPSGGDDLGDQPERTLLAWRRTALSLVAAGALVGHLAVDRAGRGVVATTLVSLAAVVAFCWLSPRRRAAAAGAALVAGVVALGVLGLVAVLG